MTVVRGDALRIPLRDASVDLIITSPPYFALRSYRDGDAHYDGQIGSEESPQAFLEALWAVTAECRRVLKPSGSMFVNLGDKYSGNNTGGGLSASGSTLKGRHHEVQQAGIAGRRTPHQLGGIPAKSLMGLPWRYANGVVDRLGLILRAELIWSKPNGLPEPVTDRVRRSHEQWFHFVKQGRYFAAVDEIREAQIARQNGWDQWSGEERFHDPLGKLPGSVWTIPSEPLVVPAAVQRHYGLPDHFAAFPQEWPRRLILGWSPSGGRVLDPFGGTGTVALVARCLGRTPINLDLSADYCRLARWRIYQSGHAAKSEERTWRDAQGVML